MFLNRIKDSEDDIYFWNHTELGRAIARNMAKQGNGIPSFLRDVLNKKEFWEYMPDEEREAKLLRLRNKYNRALYIRLAAYSIIGLTNENDEEDLKKLANHSYGLIARAAAIRLTHLFGNNALKILTGTIDEGIKKGKSESLAEALRISEMELYGVANLW